MRHKHKALERPCRTYWGSHGCRKQREHLGSCRCSCGSILEYELRDYPDLSISIFGEDAKID